MRYLYSGTIYRLYINPIFFFKYYGFEWVRPWPGDWMYLHMGVLIVLSGLIAIGLWYRISATLFFLAFTYFALLDQTNYLNHFYLLSLVSGLMIFLPAHRHFSVDAIRRPGIKSDTAPAWTLWLICFQVGVAYFYGGLSKINPDWLRGWPLKMWLPRQTDYPWLTELLRQDWLALLFSYGGLVLDLAVVPFLLWKRTRWLAFIAALIFHLMNAWLWHIGVFPWFMIPATLMFFPPSWSRQLLVRWGWKVRKEVPLPPPETGKLSTGKKVTLTLLGLYVAFQLLFPFRCVFYPGEVNWTEEGHQFSWRMKLRDKASVGKFYAREPVSGKTWTINPLDLLDPRQTEKMSVRPDMILQFAHYISKRIKEQEGYEHVEVRAKIYTSLNGRRPQLLVDPEVDLAKMPRNLKPSPWIVPLEQPHRPFLEKEDTTR